MEKLRYTLSEFVGRIERHHEGQILAAVREDGRNLPRDSRFEGRRTWVTKEICLIKLQMAITAGVLEPSCILELDEAIRSSTLKDTHCMLVRVNKRHQPSRYELRSMESATVCESVTSKHFAETLVDWCVEAGTMHRDYGFNKVHQQIGASDLPVTLARIIADRSTFADGPVCYRFVHDNGYEFSEPFLSKEVGRRRLKEIGKSVRVHKTQLDALQKLEIPEAATEIERDLDAAMAEAQHALASLDLAARFPSPHGRHRQ